MTRMDNIASLSAGLAELLHGPRMSLKEADFLAGEAVLAGCAAGLRFEEAMAVARRDPALAEAFALIDARQPDTWITDGHERDERRADPWMEPEDYEDEGSD